MFSPRTGWQQWEVEQEVSAWRWQETEFEGCKLGRVQSLARQALTRAATRYGGRVFVPSYKISWWRSEDRAAYLRAVAGGGRPCCW